MICKHCNSEIRNGAVFCPQCGQRQPSSASAFGSSYVERSAPERPRSSWSGSSYRETPPPAPERSPSYTRSSAPQINGVALGVLALCALLWFVAPFIQVWGDATALEIVSDLDSDSVLWQCAVILGAGILISGICVLCKNNGAKIAAGTSVVASVVLYIIWALDVGADDLEEIVEAFSDVWAWGWVMIVLGLITVGIVGGKKE